MGGAQEDRAPKFRLLRPGNTGAGQGTQRCFGIAPAPYRENKAARAALLYLYIDQRNPSGGAIHPHYKAPAKHTHTMKTQTHTTKRVYTRKHKRKPIQAHPYKHHYRSDLFTYRQAQRIEFKTRFHIFNPPAISLAVLPLIQQPSKNDPPRRAELLLNLSKLNNNNNKMLMFNSFDTIHGTEINNN